MNTLTRYMIKSYIGPFLMTFFIAVFVLFLQFLWKYVDDLIGKGLSPGVLAELFFYAALTMFPLALPLAILLSSLMTFGDLGEHFELVSLKSAGLSLMKIMRPLIFVALLTSISAFLFSNLVLPYVNLKWQSLIFDIQQKKPAFNIKEGVFYNGIDGYTLRIEKKEKDGINCSGIMIFDHTLPGGGNNKVITAKTGRMELSASKQFLNIVLFDGTSFEELAKSADGTQKYSMVRSRFEEQTIRFDLTGFQLTRSDEEMFRSNYEMLNLDQIQSMIDSLITENNNNHKNFEGEIQAMLGTTKKAVPKPPGDTSAIDKEKIPGFMNATVKTMMKQEAQRVAALPARTQVLDMALNVARSKQYFIQSQITQIDNYERPMNSLKIVWHKKFTLSFACFILFFVGAPLGAIIRKGGLGMPVVVSVIIFILFWVITISGEKMSKEGVIPPFVGMWMATAATLPLGIFLTIKATSDSALFDAEKYLRPFRIIAGMMKKRSS